MRNTCGGACEYVCKVRVCGEADELRKIGWMRQKDPGESEWRRTNRNSGTCPRRKRRTQVAGAWFATMRKAPAKCSCQKTQRRGGRGRSVGDADDQVNERISQQNGQHGVLTAGPSTVKWAKRTLFVHSHCSSGVGTLLGCNFHLRKYGIASMMIHGIQRPK